MAADEAIIINAILAGTREYLANAQKVAGANEEIAASSETVGRSFEHTTKRGYLMNQALFTVRRMIYGTTLAFVATGVAALRWGFQFNSAMQQARVALAPVFGSTKSLNKELDYLFNFTKYTPFQFKDVTGAFRMLYAAFHPLGISVDTTNKTIKSLTDGLAYAGKTAPGQLNRVALALQHMAYQGHLTGYAVNQLSRDGIPMLAILRKEFGLTGDQIHKVGTLGIPTLQVLDAINKYMATTPGFQNAAQRQALMTFHGQFTTFKDNMGQIMGAVEKGWFSRIQGFATRTNRFFNTLSNSLKGNGSLTGIVGAVNNRLTPGSNAVMMFWTQLSGAVHEFWMVLSRLISGLTHSYTVWTTIYSALFLIHTALWFIDRNMGLILPLITTLMPIWIAWYTYSKLNALWLGILKFEEALLTKQTKDLTFAQMLFHLWLDRSIYLEKIGIGITLAYATATDVATAAVAAAEFGLTMLAFSLQAAITKLRLLRLGMLGMAGLTITAIILLDLIPHAHKTTPTPQNPYATSNEPGAAQWFTKVPVVGGLFSQVNRLGDAINNKLHHLHIPGFASGVSNFGGGLAWVGEQGPELMSLPSGSSITPAHKAEGIFNLAESWAKGQRGDGRPLVIKVMVGQKQLGEVIADLYGDVLARA